MPTLLRAKAREIARQVTEGIDPEAEPTKILTFGEIAEEYLERYAKKEKRTWKEDERKLKKDVLPRWKHRPVSEISRREVVLLIDGIADPPRAAPHVAREVLMLISAVYKFAIGRGAVENNPATYVPLPGVRKARRVFLTAEQVRVLWKLLVELGSPSKLVPFVLRAKLITGQRTLEICRMRWDELEAEWWNLPAESTKNGKPHRVAVLGLLSELLEELRPVTGGHPWVFPGRHRKGAHLARVAQEVPLIAKTCGFPFLSRDLRKTMATVMTKELKVPQVTVARILNHTIPGVAEAHYDLYAYDEEKRAAWAAYDVWLRNTLAGAPDEARGTLVPFHR